MTGLTENHIIWLRRERGIRVAVPRKPSTATPTLLGVLGRSAGRKSQSLTASEVTQRQSTDARAARIRSGPSRSPAHRCDSSVRLRH